MRRLPLIAFAAAAACGGKAVIDPVGGGGAGTTTTSAGPGPTTSTGTGAGGQAPAPLQTDCPGGEQEGCQTELLAVTVAADWGPTASFVAADGDLLVGNRAAANSPAFLIRTEILSPDEASAAEIPIPPSPSSAVDVIDRGDVAEVLECDPAACVLVRIGPALADVEVEAAPDDARGVVALGDERCFFGQGIQCTDASTGTLTTVVPGGTWLAGDADAGKAWFVGEGGVMGRWDGAAWFDTGLSGPTLRAVTAEGGSEAVAAGDGGVVVIANDDGVSSICSTNGDWVGVTRRYGGPGHDDFSLLSATTWQTKNPTDNTWCSFGVMTPTPLALDHDTCGDETRWRILFADRWFAGQDCGP